MLVIKPIQDKNEQKEICALCGIEFNENFFAYKAHNDGELLACAQFDIENESALIDSMKQVIGSKEDFEGMFILGRAVLNFLDLCGVKTAKYFPSDPFDIRLAKSIGFKETPNGLEASLEGMFDAKCSGHCDE